MGSGNLFMVNVHVAHDCIIGDNCIFANNATLAGHVVIGDFVIFGGLSAIHQFGRVGSHAFVGGCAALNKDVPPYVMAAGNYAKPFGVNSEVCVAAVSAPRPSPPSSVPTKRFSAPARPSKRCCLC